MTGIAGNDRVRSDPWMAAASHCRIGGVPCGRGQIPRFGWCRDSVVIRTDCWQVAQLLVSSVLVALAGCAGFERNVVHEQTSMFGQIVVTDDGDGLRSLRFGRNGITQSTIRVGDPDHLQFGYARLAQAGFVLACADQADAVKCMPKRVLVVGLGGGSIPVFVHRHFPRTSIDVVEIDPAVLDVAKRFFGFSEDARMQVHVADGRGFIERAPHAYYDVIVLDAFGSAEVPMHLATVEFLEAVRRAVAPGGVVVSNLWSRLYNRHYESMLRTYQEVFADLRVLEARQSVNHVLLASPRPITTNESQMVARARLLSRANGFGFDLAELIADSLLATPSLPSATAVLRDVASCP